jgi:hypothetical protein
MAEPIPPLHPARPRLIVRVGVTGHRWDKLRPGDREAVEQRFHAVFESIEKVVDEIHTDEDRVAGYRSPDPSAAHPKPPALRILSGLAEGTDRVAVQVARSRERAWQLTAILPFAKDRYIKDFVKRKKRDNGTEIAYEQGEPGYKEADPESVREFDELIAAAEVEGGVQVLDGNPDAPGGYAKLATALSLNSEVIVALWDGEEPKKGGTGHVARLAREQGIPVVRVPVDGIENPWLWDPTDEDQGRGGGLTALEKHFRRLLAAPNPARVKGHSEPDLREDYFAETASRTRYGAFYTWFFNLIAPVKTKPVTRKAAPATNRVEALQARWEAEWKEQGASPALAGALARTGVHEHYSWASHLAANYAGRYRSAFLTNYILSWLAVTAAAVGGYFHLTHNDVGTLVAAIFEVGLLFTIVTIYNRSRRHQLHAHWLQYRRLAEWLRLLPMLLPLGRTPVLGVDTNPLLSVRESWVDWMFRAIVREAGVLPIDLGTELPGARGILGKGVLDGQIAYHTRTAEWNARADRTLHRLASATFRIALWLALANLILAVVEQVFHKQPISGEIQNVLLIVTLVLPALGAAIHGLRSQGEYEETAIRSTRIMERLQDLRGRFDQQKSPTVDSTAEVATQTASVMNSELSAWFIAYQSKTVPTG